MQIPWECIGNFFKPANCSLAEILLVGKAVHIHSVYSSYSENLSPLRWQQSSVISLPPEAGWSPWELVPHKVLCVGLHAVTWSQMSLGEWKSCRWVHTAAPALPPRLPCPQARWLMTGFAGERLTDQPSHLTVKTPLCSGHPAVSTHRTQEPSQFCPDRSVNKAFPQIPLSSRFPCHQLSTHIPSKIL